MNFETTKSYTWLEAGLVNSWSGGDVLSRCQSSVVGQYVDFEFEVPSQVQDKRNLNF